MTEINQNMTDEHVSSTTNGSPHTGYVVLAILVGFIIIIFLMYLFNRDGQEKLMPQETVIKEAVPSPQVISVKAPMREASPTVIQNAEQEAVQMAVSYLTLDSLMATIESGEPYEIELALLSRLVPFSFKARLDSLKPYAVSGIPSLEKITQKAKEILETHHKEEASSESMAVQLVTSLLNVRKKSSSASPFLTALRHHDVSGACTLTQKLIQEGYPLESILGELQELEIFFGHVREVRTFISQNIMNKLNLKPTQEGS